jgi:hypothetical protein
MHRDRLSATSAIGFTRGVKYAVGSRPSTSLQRLIRLDRVYV